MANNAVNTVRSWFAGSSREEVALPRFFTARFGSLLLSLERMALALVAVIVESFCYSQGYYLLGKVCFIVWIVMVALIVWDFIRAIQRRPSPIYTSRGIDTYFVPKWYARLIAGTTAILVTIFVFVLLF